MSNPYSIYKANYIDNLPSGVTYNSEIARFFYNGQRFFTPQAVESYRIYLSKFIESPLSPISSVSQNGWETTYTGDLSGGLDPVSNPITVQVTRQGYNSSGNSESVSENLTLMKHVRQPYPNQSLNTVDTVSLSGFVYNTDAIPGVTNSSTRLAPKPVAAWITPQYSVSDTNSLSVRLAVAHAYGRSGRPVAAVRFTATDGVSTSSVLVNTMVLASFSETGLNAPCFEGTLDLSGLVEGLITVDATIYPWVGDSFTLSSDGLADSINIGPLNVVNNSSGGVGRVFCYVDPVSGDDSTGVASTTEPTAQSNPFSTLSSAVTAAKNANSALFSRSNAGGAVIVLLDGTHTWGSVRSAAGATTFPVIFRGESRSGTILQDAGSSTTSSLPPHFKFERLTIRKTGGSLIMLDSSASSTKPRVLILDDVTLDINGQSNYQAWIYRCGRIFAYNSDCSSLLDAFSTVAKMCNMVGCNYSGLGTALYNAVGCNLSSAFSVDPTANRETPQGQLLSHNFISQSNPARNCIKVENEILSGGFAVVGCVVESYGGDTTPSVYMNADGNLDVAENILFIHNTVVGSRVNWLYQDSGTLKIDKSGYRKFNVQEYHNTKSDVFASNGNLTGNWSEIHNVGSLSNASLLGANNSAIYETGSWLGEVAALGDVSGSSSSPLNPDWVSDASFSGTGLGGGDYSPGPSTQLPNVPAGLAHYPYDLNGNAISNDGTDYVGAIVT